MTSVPMTRWLFPALGIVTALCMGSEQDGPSAAGSGQPHGTSHIGPNAALAANGGALSCGPRMLADGDVCVHLSIREDDLLFGHMGAQFPLQSGSQSNADAE
jgi:hypothetical protein